MADPTITPQDVGTVIVRDAAHRDGLLTFAGAGTVVEGTILARDSVSGNYVPYVQGGTTNEDGIPKALATYDIVALGAGNEPMRAAVHGVYKRERLVIDADGDASNVTDVVIDELRVYGLLAIDHDEQNILDNS